MFHYIKMKVINLDRTRADALLVPLEFEEIQQAGPDTETQFDPNGEPVKDPQVLSIHFKSGRRILVEGSLESYAARLQAMRIGLMEEQQEAARRAQEKRAQELFHNAGLVTGR